MSLKCLDIVNFRRFKRLELNFSPVINFFYGDNAVGKTTVLEAIHLLCLAKSFRTRFDIELIKFNEDFYKVQGVFVSNDKIEREVTVSYSESNGRSIIIGAKPVAKFSQLIGNFPAIVLSSQDHRITTGPPSERRQFVDILLCQLSARYLSNLRDYNRILKQKNQVLQHIAQGKKASFSEVEPWNFELARKGCEVMKLRKKICLENKTRFCETFNKIAGKDSELIIEYLPNIDFENERDIPDRFNLALKKVEKKECALGFSIVGPHRDDFLFELDKKNLRQFGSRGEHKTALVALKATEAMILGEKKDVTPILLLDDLFTELDEKRISRILQLFQDRHQLFITSTLYDREKIKKINFDPEMIFFHFSDNKVAKADYGQSN